MWLQHDMRAYAARAQTLVDSKQFSMELLVRGYRLRQYHVQISTSPQPGNSGILLVNHELGRHYVTTHESMRDSMVRENGCIIAQVTYVANKDENVTATCIPSVFDGILVKSER